MQDEQLEDLKQFIGAAVSQSEERLRTEIKSVVSESESRLRGEISGLRQEMLDGFAGVGEAIDELHQENRVIDQRLTNLEQAA